MESFHRHCCWFLFFGFFLGFLISHECDHSFRLLLTSELLWWSIILSSYTPPWNPASGLVICSIDYAAGGDWSFSCTACLSHLLANGGPPVKNRPGSIIQWRRAYSARRRERPQDLESTSLWPSAVSFPHMPQPLVNIGISLITSSAWTQGSVVEGDSKSAAVFMGR